MFPIVVVGKRGPGRRDAAEGQRCREGDHERSKSNEKGGARTHASAQVLTFVDGSGSAREIIGCYGTKRT